MSKRILIAIGVVLALLAGFFVLRGDGVEVTVAEAARDTLSVTIPAEGETRARERFTVAAPISGRLTRLDLEEGDEVKDGQLLTRLYPAPQDAQVVATARAEVDAAAARLRQTESRLREAELQASQALREVERRRPLAEMGALTPERMEQAELTADVAERRREAAEADVASAGAALESARARLLGAASPDTDATPVEVRAPVAGRVLTVPDQSERVVAAGAPLVTLADVDGLEIVLDILSEDAVRVERGNDLVITGWGGESTLRGTVRSVTLVGHTEVSALGVEEQRVDVIADLHDRPPTLGTGYRVSGEIVVWSGRNVLTIPTSALFRSGHTWRAFVVEDGRARIRDVEVGRRNERSAEVLEGIAEGDRVILFPPESVEDGAAVTIES